MNTIKTIRDDQELSFSEQEKVCFPYNRKKYYGIVINFPTLYSANVSVYLNGRKKVFKVDVCDLEKVKEKKIENDY